MKLENKKILQFIVAALMIPLVAGCLSQNVLEGSRQRVALRKANQIENPVKRDRAIKAIDLGDGGVGVGIDVTNMEALKERWALQLGAALGDAGMIYGGYLLLDELEKELNDSNTTFADGPNGGGAGGNNSGNDTIIVNGDGNITTTGSSGEIGEGRTGDPVIVE